MRIAVLSFDRPQHACAQLRLLAPLGTDADVSVDWAVRLGSGEAHIDTEALQRADLIAVQRFFPRALTAPLLERLLSAGPPIVYETDDLLTEVPPSNPNAPHAQACRDAIERLMRAARAVTLSTPALAAAYEPLRRDLHVIPNRVDTRRLLVRARESRGESSAVVIGYCGTATHRDDLELIETALEGLARRFGERVRFRFAGCITDRLARLPGVEFEPLEPDYSSWMARLCAWPVDIALGPLADSRFNRCKSPIKWLELAACGIPGVFSDLPPYAGWIAPGETGLLAGPDPDAWYEALCALVLDAPRRRRIADAARAEVERCHSLASGGGELPALYRDLVRRGGARRASSASRPPVSIVIPVFNRADLTRACLESVLAHTAGDVEIVVVDNGSSDSTPELLASAAPRVRALRNASNRGFARACNQGASAARGEALLFLNNDTRVHPGWLEPLLEELERAPTTAIAGSRLLYPDGRIQHAGVGFARPDAIPYHVYAGAPADHPAVSRRRELRAVTAACMLVRRSAFFDLGGFDEGYANGFEDVDLCLRARARGWRSVYQPASVVTHLEEQTPGRKARDQANLRRFQARWSARLWPDETRLLLEDGCVAHRRAPGSPVRVTRALRDAAERRAWTQVARAETLLESGGLAALAGEPPRARDWPAEPDALEWGAQLCRAAGLRDAAAQFEARLGLAPASVPAPPGPDFQQRALRGLMRQI